MGKWDKYAVESSPTNKWDKFAVDASTMPQNEPQMATGALAQTQGKSIPQQAMQGLMDAPGVYAKEIGGMLNAIPKSWGQLGAAGAGIGNAMFNRPIDNLINTAKESFGSYDKAYNTLYNNPIGVTTTLAGIKPGIQGMQSMAANPMAGINKAGAGAAKIMEPALDRLQGLPKNYAPVIAKNAEGFRKLLNPGKGEISALEVKGGKDIDTFMNLAAKEKLIIGKDATGKLDTSVAARGLAPSIDALDDVLQSYLDSTPGQTFNISDLSKSAQGSLKEMFPNALEYKQAVKELNSYLAAEKKKFGTNNLTAGQLNELKRGMWKVSYNGVSPNSNKVARAIGRSAQQKIEALFPEGEIAQINTRMGDYLTLQKLLDNAHGRIVPGGKVGKAVSQLTGTAVGAAAGGMIPGVGHIVGPVVGNLTGGFVHDLLHDPTLKTQMMANRMKGYKGDPLKLPTNKSNQSFNGDVFVPVDAELVMPGRLPSPQQPNPYARMLPSPQQSFGQVANPEIRQGFVPQGPALPPPPRRIMRSDRALPSPSNVGQKTIYQSGEIYKPREFNKNVVRLDKKPKADIVEMTNPNDPKVLDYLAQFFNPVKVARMSGSERLSYVNMSPNQLRDIVIGYGKKETPFLESQPTTEFGKHLARQMQEKASIPLHPASEGKAALRKLIKLQD